MIQDIHHTNITSRQDIHCDDDTNHKVYTNVALTPGSLKEESVASFTSKAGTCGAIEGVLVKLSPGVLVKLSPGVLGKYFLSSHLHLTMS